MFRKIGIGKYNKSYDYVLFANNLLYVIILNTYKGFKEVVTWHSNIPKK